MVHCAPGFCEVRVELVGVDRVGGHLGCALSEARAAKREGGGGLGSLGSRLCPPQHVSTQSTVVPKHGEGGAVAGRAGLPQDVPSWPVLGSRSISAFRAPAQRRAALDAWS